MSLVPNKALEGASGNQGYKLQRSLRFRSSASAYLNRTPASASNRKTWTWSGWVKRGALGVERGIFSVGASAANFALFFHSSDQLRVWTNGGNASIYTNAVYRDPSAWYHIILQSSSISPYFNLYVNGVQVTSFAYDNRTTYPGSSDTEVNSTDTHRLAGWYNGSIQTCDCYLAEVNFIDGQALTPSSFGQTDSTTGAWIPKRYGGSYGTNGFYLNFSDNTSATTLAYDKSGNGNNWTANNISTTAGATYDSMTDVPTLTSATAANFCTLNPLDSYDYSGGAVGTYVTDANLKLAWTATAGQKRTFSTIAMPTSGKWYFEVQVLTTSANGNPIGISPITTNTNQNLAVGAATGELAFECADGNKVSAGTATSYGTAPSTNDVVMCAVDIDNAKIWWGKQGTWFASGDPAAGTNAAFTTLSQTVQYKIGGTVRGAVHAYNFGQRPFSYTPPTGFKALNTFNLPDPTIKKPNQYMDATLYTGNGSTLSVTNSGSFAPDLVWVKSRSNALNNNLFDTSRGVYNRLASNTTANEDNNTDSLTAFNSNGFSLGTNATVNTNAATYVGWQWKESAAAGFDVVTYSGTGSTTNISHNLGVAPSMIIVKAINTSGNGWYVCHVGSWGGDGNGLFLNNTASTYNRVTDLGGTGITAMTSSYFTATTGSGTFLNTSGTTYVAYVFAAIPGMSAFGSYVGNSYSGGTDGTFVYLGFKPKYVMVKMTSSSGYDWVIYDSARNTTNVVQNYLLADQSYSENAGGLVADIDFVSNGFKLRNSGSSSQSTNIGNQTYIYAAFAENPFKYSNAR